MVALPAACVPASMASTATGAAAAVGSPAGSAVGSPAGSAVAESSALAVPAVAAGRSTSVEHAATTVLVAVPRREPDRIQPVDAERRVLRVTVTQGLLDDLAQARAALSHKFPEGRFEDVVREGLRLVIEAHVRRRGGVPARAAETAGPAPVGHDAPVMARAPVVAAAVRMTAAAPAPPAAAPAPVAAAAPAVASSAAAAARVTTAAPVAAAPSRAEGPAEFVPRDRGESRHEPLRRRRIPVGVQRAVWARDGGRCTFTGPDGTRCGSRYQLQLDHLVLAAYGGPDTVANLRLVCRSHNLHAAAELLGSGFMDRCRTGRSRPRALPPGEVAMGAPASR
jgi:hypothetical protein